MDGRNTPRCASRMEVSSDDLIVYRVSSEELFLCVNASNREKDFRWILSNLSGDATARDESDEWSQIALQGPKAMGILGEVLPGEDWDSMRPFPFPLCSLAGASVRVATTRLHRFRWSRKSISPMPSRLRCGKRCLLRENPHGLVPAGLGARDTLRLEKLPLRKRYRYDNPIEAGLQWVVRLQKDEFIGKSALERFIRGNFENWSAFACSTGIARSGYPCLSTGLQRTR